MDHPEFHDLIVASPGELLICLSYLHNGLHDNGQMQELILEISDDTSLLPLHTSLVVTLGGDGTILHVSNLFSQGECPPVLSFSMGTLGFLLPFRKCAHLSSRMWSGQLQGNLNMKSPDLLI